MNMQKKKRIKLRRGAKKKLAIICGVSTETVRKACLWNTDSEAENLVRKRAEELGFIKLF